MGELSSHNTPMPEPGTDTFWTSVCSGEAILLPYWQVTPTSIYGGKGLMTMWLG